MTLVVHFFLPPPSIYIPEPQHEESVAFTLLSFSTNMAVKLVLLFAIVELSCLVDSRPTHCERWKGDEYFRCGKDDYRADNVLVRNRAGTAIAFKVRKYMSVCGQPGEKDSDEPYSLPPGASVNIDFSEAGPGICKQLFVYNCEINNRRANCLNAVIVTPNLV